MLHQNIIHVKTCSEFNTGYLLPIIQTLRAQFPIYMYNKLMYAGVKMSSMYIFVSLNSSFSLTGKIP